MAKCKHYVEAFDCCARTSVWVDGLLCTDSCNYRDDVFGEPNCRYFEEKADVVPVVRCKDCKYFKAQKQSVNWKNKKKYCCRVVALKVNENDYCSYGERRH